MTAPYQDIATAAFLGVLIGYLAHGHWDKLDWLVRLLVA
jgi:hypothetical protein